MVGGSCIRAAAHEPYVREEPWGAVGVSMKYWDDWTDPEDMQALWERREVSEEWKAAGEVFGKKVHMLRDLDGQPYVSQTEMQAIAEIVIERYFNGKLSRAMICAIAEIQSQLHPLTLYCHSKSNDPSCGLMRMRRSTVEWLAREKGYTAYTVDWKSSMLFKPFVSVYYAAAYLKWLSAYDGKKRSEEFMVRSYASSPKEFSNKCLESYWNKYLSVKQNLPMLRDVQIPATSLPPIPPREAISPGTAKCILYETSPGRKWIYWHVKASPQDMQEMWARPEVKKEWLRTGETRDRVRFSLDAEMRPYLKRVELKAVAEIITRKFFADRRIDPAMLCTIAEISSKRLLFGEVCDTGIMQTPFSTASWLYTNLGYKSYKLKCVEDLSRPFVSMYFGAAYICWLSTYGGRMQTDKFVVQSYAAGPQTDGGSPEAGPFWLKYIDALPQYHCSRKPQRGHCCIQ